MDRNNSRYTFRRQGQQLPHQQQQHSQQQQHQSSSSSPNYDRNSSASSTSSAYSSASSTSMSHDELIRFIREAWNKVKDQAIVADHTEADHHQLKNFKPFNLEEYWGQRFVQNIHVSQHQ